MLAIYVTLTWPRTLCCNWHFSYVGFYIEAVASEEAIESSGIGKRCQQFS